MQHKLIILHIICMILLSCAEAPETNTTRPTSNHSASEHLFKIHNRSATGISIVNTIKESPELNVEKDNSVIQGAGVGIINLNNDDLPDLVVNYNMVPNQLYVNKGNFKFENVTLQSKLKATNGWSTGVTIVDIDGDNDDDIYITNGLHLDSKRRKNNLYINDGNGVFNEEASQHNLDDDGYGVMSYFFDYDNDGDLDVLILNQPPSHMTLKKARKSNDAALYSNKLLRNDGGDFVDITQQSGIESFNYSLSAITFDYNEDGFMDIFIANDYFEPDQLFINNGKGKFVDIALNVFHHTSNFSMGSDLGDIDNDGLLDIFVADMVAEDNYRQKTNMSGMNPELFWSNVAKGFNHQYMFNTLHLNNQLGSYSEIAQMANVAMTDWSWTPLFIDFNLDGYKDLIVTNGTLREIRNKDHNNYRKSVEDSLFRTTGNARISSKQLYEISTKAPQQKLSNKLFLNNGDLTFEKVDDQWGLNQKTITQAAAYADFDNDGDLDIVMSSNIKGIDILQSLAVEKQVGNYLNIILEGKEKNTKAINAQVSIEYANGLTQVQNFSPYRGYISSNQGIIQFGLGDVSMVDKVLVTFVGGNTVSINNVKANQTITIQEEDGKDFQPDKSPETLLSYYNGKVRLEHKENAYDDYEHEILIPYKMSSLGPTMAVGDVNGDKNDDIFFGGSAGTNAILLFGTSNGTIINSNNTCFSSAFNAEDSCSEFFDCDGDGDLDLYVCGGSNEFEVGHDNYIDRLYINNGDGMFVQSTNMPKTKESTHTVLPFDYDDDGDLDLFVGGRQVPRQYGASANSYLYTNDGSGSFMDSSQDLAPDFTNLGMVTDATYADITQDGKPELVISGEWMPLTAFSWNNSQLEKVELSTLENTHGLWNAIEVVDINNDGYNDIIGANLGLNNKYKASEENPFKIYVDDFDANGSNDVYLGYYNNDGVCYPVRGRQCSSEQMPFVKKKFENYNEFALASIDDVLKGKKSEKTISKRANTFAHTVYFGNESGGFTGKPLPNSAQRSIGKDILITNLDKDPENEIYLIGNYYDREVETTRSDAGIGCIINVAEDMTYSMPSPLEIGALAKRDARVVKAMQLGGNDIIAVANNNFKLQFFKANN